jgi:hypothetical protein
MTLVQVLNRLALIPADVLLSADMMHFPSQPALKNSSHAADWHATDKRGGRKS